ncbi:MAG: sulfite exporter TauE/SafE family protein [Desulfuromonadaceae bacterium]|nr:sulfite exporter TauE/SafE family protein [Desulfuromonadaceae bacterium]
MTYWFLYLITGIAAGVFAGLFGLGGGVIVVPILTFLFTAQQMPEAHILHMALGTSLASIMFTSLSSMRAHNKRGAVEWPIAFRIAPGIMVGAFSGSWLASQISTRHLKIFFVLFLFYVASRIAWNATPAVKKPYTSGGIIGAGALIGTISSLVGIGGGTMSVPFLLRCNASMHHAIGTSSAIGFPIALAGAVGYAINGANIPGLPAHTLGFIYLPALLLVSLASVTTAPLGARMAHKLPVSRLKKIFAGLLIIVGMKMLAGLF